MDEKKGKRKVFRFRRGTILLLCIALFIAVLVGMDSAPGKPRSGHSSPDNSESLQLRVHTGRGVPQEKLTEEESGWEAVASRSRLWQTGKGVFRSLAAIGAQVLSIEEQKEVSQSLKESGDDDDDEDGSIVLHPQVTSKKVRDRLQEAISLTRKAQGGSSKRSTSALLVNVSVERVPLAGLPGLDGILSITDGSCKSRTESGDCLPHGFCIASECRCTQAYAGDICRTPKRPFTRRRSSFEGRTVLSVAHVRRVRGVKYPTFPEAPTSGSSTGLASQERHFFEAPFFSAGKVNRVVWGHLQQNRLMELEPMMSQALLDLLPGSDILQNAVFDTCAIVGNSGFNLLFPDGAKIDEHDFIIRLYNAPSGASPNGGQKWEQFVGKRTSLRIIDESLIGFHEGSEIRLMNVFSKEGLFGHFQFLNKEPEEKSYLFDPDFATYVADQFGHAPTPLALALFLALQKCVSISVYGTKWSPGYGVPELYYENSASDADVVHLQGQEINLVEAFARERLVSVVQPCMGGCEAESKIKCRNCAPGSSCACGQHHPLPVALPGFCHVAGNYSCFYKCEGKWKRKCHGGPGSSECPSGMDAAALPCALRDEDEASPEDLPWWANKGGMKEFDSKFDRGEKQKPTGRSKSKKTRAISLQEIAPEEKTEHTTEKRRKLLFSP